MRRSECQPSCGSSRERLGEATHGSIPSLALRRPELLGPAPPNEPPASAWIEPGAVLSLARSGVSVSPARETDGLLVVLRHEPVGKLSILVEKPVVGVRLVKSVAEEGSVRRKLGARGDGAMRGGEESLGHEQGGDGGAGRLRWHVGRDLSHPASCFADSLGRMLTEEVSQGLAAAWRVADKCEEVVPVG